MSITLEAHTHPIILFLSHHLTVRRSEKHPFVPRIQQYFMLVIFVDKKNALAQ